MDASTPPDLPGAPTLHITFDPRLSPFRSKGNGDITVIRSISPRFVGKSYHRDKTGEVKKTAVAHITSGIGFPLDVPDAAAMRRLLEVLTEEDDLVICMGRFHGADGQPFHVVTEEALANMMKVAPEEAPGGVQVIGGKRIAARLKRGTDPSPWLLLEGDDPEGTPEKWRGIDIAARLARLEPLVPGISSCERVELRGSSSRVVPPGGAPGPRTHAWVCITAPNQIEPLRLALKVRTAIRDLAYRSPRRSRETGEIVAHEMRTVIDLAVLLQGRPVFCAKPDVQIDGYETADAGITIVMPGGGPLDISGVELPGEDELRQYRERTGQDLRFGRDAGGALLVTARGELTHETLIERRAVVKPLREWLAGMKEGEKLRCETPFRASESEAAFVRKLSGGRAFVYDIGTQTKYEMAGVDDFEDLPMEDVGTPPGAASVPGAGSSPPQGHPLLRFVPLGDRLEAPRWVVTGFIADGVTAIAGQHGGGKTLALVALALKAAGLHAPSDPLGTRHWRHVIYITEDVAQLQRTLVGTIGQGAQGVTREGIEERFHIVAAARMTVDRILPVAREYAVRLTRDDDGVPVPPLVVFDTRAAIIATEDENDNAEASTIIAALKQNFAGLPVWLVGHVPKSSVNRADVAALTMRGASAIEADAHQVVYLAVEGAGRFLVQGKARFEPNWPDLAITSHIASRLTVNEYGEDEEVVVRWVTVAPLEGGRAALAKRIHGQEEAADLQALRDEILGLVRTGQRAGERLSRNDVASGIGRRRGTVLAVLQGLLDQVQLLEIDVPVARRRTNSRARFLVALTEEEAARYIFHGVEPPVVATLASWRFSVDAST